MAPHRPSRPADPELIGARLAQTLTHTPAANEGLDAVLPDPLEDLDGYLAVTAELDLDDPA